MLPLFHDTKSPTSTHDVRDEDAGRPDGSDSRLVAVFALIIRAVLTLAVAFFRAKVAVATSAYVPFLPDCDAVGSCATGDIYFTKGDRLSGRFTTCRPGHGSSLMLKGLMRLRLAPWSRAAHTCACRPNVTFSTLTCRQLF